MRRTGAELAPAPRILLAHDLSPAAQRATALIAGTSWPRGTVVQIVSSPIGIGPELSSFALLSEARAHAKQVQATIGWTHERVAAELVDAGLSVESRVVHGRPARALVASAERFGADLIVVGARDRGPITATLLGSVSRAIVENARCSVLVARGSPISRVLLATDGSTAARLATAMVAAWPLFAGVTTRVVGVGSASPGDADPTTNTRPSMAIDAAVALLDTGERTIEREVRLGDAGTEVVAAALSWAADFVALGAYGEPFLRRLLLGSVARRVLDAVKASVLVARPTGTEGAE